MENTVDKLLITLVKVKGSFDKLEGLSERDVEQFNEGHRNCAAILLGLSIESEVMELMKQDRPCPATGNFWEELGVPLDMATVFAGFKVRIDK